jgi:hypothetical protein
MSRVNDSPEPDRSAAEDAEVLARERRYYLNLLGEIPVERARLEERERDLARFVRSIGVPWDEIAAAVGLTAEAALERYGEPEPGRAPF